MDSIIRKFGIIRRRDGFTLVELIVVLIIIGILLALVIPNLTGYIDKAQATSCRKNRVELEKIYRYDTLLAEAEEKTVTIDTLLATENGKKLTCPSGGTYTYNEATGHLTCTKHNDSVVGMSPIAVGVIQTINDLKIEHNFSTNMDSGATNGNYTPKLIAKLKANGLSFEDMNIKSWAYRPSGANGNELYWSSVDISEFILGDSKVTIPIMKYNEKTEAYSVWTTGITTTDVNGQTYNILKTPTQEVTDSAVLNDSADSLAKKLDYDTMYAIYRQALADYNK